VSSGSAGSVLVVDDDEPIRLLIGHELAAGGFQVWLAADAAQAVEMLGSETGIGFVLTDYMMPGSMDGLGLAEWIRDKIPSISVALTSAKSREAMQAAGLRAEQAFFRKPIRFDDLRRHVACALQRTPQAMPTKERPSDGDAASAAT
jgi:CheY-like chemotaxis protein